MPVPAIALSFGHDLLLLETRRWLLARAHVELIGVQSLDAFDSALQSRRFDLLLLCHSLSTMDCEAALCLIALYSPLVKTLILDSGFNTCLLPVGVEQADVNRNPAEFIARVQSLTYQTNCSGFR